MMSNLSAQRKVTVEWDAMAGEWDDIASQYGVTFYQLLQRTLKNESIFHDNHNKKPIVIDFGCGTGIITEKLQKASSQIICIDASTNMIELLIDKIRDYDWNNVVAYAIVLGHLDENTFQDMFHNIIGTIDLIIASSVMSYIPNEDYEITMMYLGRLLKSGGYFFHTDLVYDEDNNPNGMTIEKANRLYNAGGLQEKTIQITKLDTTTVSIEQQQLDTFVGVAVKL